MRKLPIITAFLLGTSFFAQAQEEPAFKPVFSIELSTGIQPLHSNYSPSTARKRELAERGQEYVGSTAYRPVINLTGVYRPWKRTEFTFTAGVTWCHHQLMQYDEFGTDPDGKPRYNYINSEKVRHLAGWTDSTPLFSATLQWRHLWTPRHDLVLYSGAGAGVVFISRVIYPVPSVTPIGLRWDIQHFYIFAEGTIGPLATFVQGGLGWHF